MSPHSAEHSLGPGWREPARAQGRAWGAAGAPSPAHWCFRGCGERPFESPGSERWVWSLPDVSVGRGMASPSTSRPPSLPHHQGPGRDMQLVPSPRGMRDRKRGVAVTAQTLGAVPHTCTLLPTPAHLHPSCSHLRPHTCTPTPVPCCPHLRPSCSCSCVVQLVTHGEHLPSV